MTYIRTLLSVALIAATTLAACAEHPQYLKQDQAFEAGPDIDPGLGSGQIALPFRLETEDEIMERMALQQELTELAGMDIQVPVISLGDISVAMEWSLKNLSEEDGTARIYVDGSNERFTYVPDAFVIEGEQGELPPPLLGNIPISVPAGDVVTGVFREDQLYEAAVDLAIITSSALNPFATILQHHDDLDELVGDGGLLMLPEAIRDRAEEVIAHVVQLDIRLDATQHMVLEYTLRVRDHGDTLHEMLLDAPAEELSGFVPAQFAPASAAR